MLAALGQRLEATADVDRLLAGVHAELDALGLEAVSIDDGRDGCWRGDDGGEAEGVAAEGAAGVRAPCRNAALHGAGAAARPRRATAGRPRRPSRRRRCTPTSYRRPAARARAGGAGARGGAAAAAARPARRPRPGPRRSPAPARRHCRRSSTASRRPAPGVDALRDELRATVLDVRRVVEGPAPARARRARPAAARRPGRAAAHGRLGHSPSNCASRPAAACPPRSRWRRSGSSPRPSPTSFGTRAPRGAGSSIEVADSPLRARQSPTTDVGSTATGRPGAGTACTPCASAPRRCAARSA